VLEFQYSMKKGCRGEKVNGQEPVGANGDLKMPVTFGRFELSSRFCLCVG